MLADERQVQSTQSLEVIEHTLEPSELTCPTCGHMRQPTSDDEAEALTLVDRSHVLKKHVSRKYGCTCGTASVSAKGPQPVPGASRYSLDFASEVACSKYASAVPFERQARLLSQQNPQLDLSTAALWEQVEKLALVLRLSYNALRAYVLSSELVHVDETRWTSLNKAGKAGKTSWVWSIARHDAVYYQLAPGRGDEQMRDLLDGFHGTALVDDFIVYLSVKQLLPDLNSVLSWGHVRRAFNAALPEHPACRRALELLDELFEIEQDPPDWQSIQDEQRRSVALDYIRALRKERAEPVIEALADWAAQTLPEQPPTSGLYLAIDHMQSQWSSLTHFLVEPRVPLSNLSSAPASSIAPAVKSHHASKSVRGTEVAALFYTLVESASLAGVDPFKYVYAAAEAAISQGVAVLPQQLRASRRPPRF